MLEDFHFIKNKTTYVAFHIPSSKFFRLTSKSYSLAEDVANDENISILSKIHNLSEDDIMMFVDNLNSSVPTINNVSSKNKKKIARVTIHVANDCNLACTYCYGNEGTYNHEKKLMSAKTAEDIAYFLINNFTEVEGIVFFGGEPLLNPQIIKLICEIFRKHEKEFPIPKFSIITNGTILNSCIIDLIDEYLETVVVSIDGPQEANDLHRKYKNGNGSYNKIEKFITTIKSKTKALVKFEATYTNDHYSRGYSKQAISSFIKNTFKIQGSLVEEMFDDSYDDRVSDTPTSKEIKELFYSSNGENIVLSENFIDIILSIAKGAKRQMCPIGEDIVAISVDGEILPCHVLLNDDKFSFGNIYSENIFNNPSIYYDQFPFLKTSSLKIGTCSSCWIRNLCGGCVLRWFYDNNKKVFFNNPHPELCKATKSFYEEIILNLAELQKDNDQYIKFVNVLTKELNPSTCSM
ncbi:radical SAM/SPASM domain-containing protein [Marinifilum caeruleilacunae]|uniref:4Fe-4S cluster-binding domain-containing protein n=1 Tax=Marinifilum caeruleilacunae TaxID=2499076 RepID=A0ABX1WSA8_9BACT|nr:radical SAM protein [Marinifilum caeruleilacunae]NOU58882.1 4Fe-4S cluster-binding domain-containing protein [Marinifilum caeruleilacunae]